MKKNLLTNLFLILGLSVIYGADNPAKYKDGGRPTSIDVRSKFFKTHLDDSKIIFEEMRKWHEEDYAALVQIIKLPENQKKLQVIHNIINKTFEAETITHGKIAAVYKAYSAIISSKSEMENAQDAEDERSVDDIIQDVIGYCSDNKIPEQKRNNTLFICDINQIILAEKYNLRWLPYVSRNGISSFRVLNSQFGMKAPLIGLPLERSSYDGNLDETPISFFKHDANHGQFSDANNNTPAVINFIYDCYHEADALVSQLTDSKTQALCDFFLFEVGHELFFDVKTTWENFGEERTFTIQHSNHLNEVCDNVLRHLEKDILKFDQPSTLHSLWDKDRETILLPFVNLNHEGQQLFTLMELIHDFELSKEKPLSEKDIADLKPGFLNTLPPRSFNSFEYWCMVELNVNSYNQLFGYKYFFNKNGIAFDLWVNDQFQADAIIAVFKEACDTFKGEVGPRFNSFDNLSAKNWHEEQK
ncbi:MAG: hypothetical protein ACOH2E_02050 [Candidatus Paracaedibacter sp.]